MAGATLRRQDWCAQLDLLAEFGGHAPRDYHAVVEATAEKQKKIGKGPGAEE